MATLTITKKSVCAAGGHYVLTFAAGAQSKDISIETEDLKRLIADPGSIDDALVYLLVLLSRFYTLAQLGQKLNAGPITITV